MVLEDFLVDSIANLILVSISGIFSSLEDTGGIDTGGIDTTEA
jgi:hypothetical protein